jgi:hypothetical protein
VRSPRNAEKPGKLEGSVYNLAIRLDMQKHCLVVAVSWARCFSLSNLPPAVLRTAGRWVTPQRVLRDPQQVANLLVREALAFQQQGLHFELHPGDVDAGIARSATAPIVLP